MKRCLGLSVSLVILGFAGCKTASTSDVSEKKESDKNGNGGTVVICEKNYDILDKGNIMVTDLYELRLRERELRKEVIPADVDIKSYAKIAEAVIERFKFRDFGRYKEMKELLVKADPETGSDAAIAANLHLLDIGDTGPISLPGPDCHIEYAALQYTSDIPGNKTFNYRQEIWRRLNVLNRAVLKVHEVLFRVYDVKSENIRFVVQHALADRLPEKGAAYAWFAGRYLTDKVIDVVDTAFKIEEILPSAKASNFTLVDGMLIVQMEIYGKYLRDFEKPKYLYGALIEQVVPAAVNESGDTFELKTIEYKYYVKDVISWNDKGVFLTLKIYPGHGLPSSLIEAVKLQKENYNDGYSRANFKWNAKTAETLSTRPKRS